MGLSKAPLLAASIISSSIFLSACSDSNSTTSTATTQVGGTVFASYVDGASVLATDSHGNTIAGPVLSNAMGIFSLNIPDQHLNESLIFTASGGQFKDEATGNTANNSALSAFIEAGTLSNSDQPQFSLTPSSSIVRQLIDEHSLSLADATSRFKASFGYTPDSSIIPVDATQAPGSADEESVLAGLRAAAFSQLNSDLNLPSDAQGRLLAILADDLADGSFDGKQSGSPLTIALPNNETFSLNQNIQNSFNSALINFRNGDRNKTELNDAAIGQPVFAKTAMSDSYVVTYIPGMVGSKQGKTQFSLSIHDHEGNPVSDLTPSVAPLMFMSDRKHSTPFTEITEDSEEAGLYHATVYYLMASTMANGNSMGFWQLTINLGEESVEFYPHVAMAMSARANLKSQTAKVPGMMGTEESRTYILFNNGLSEDDNSHSFSVFIATKESMMNFPALTLGSYHELEISSISVEMSTDEMNWINAEDHGKGIWTATGLTDIDGSIYVRLLVNNEQSTEDGKLPDGEGDNAEFMFNMGNMDHESDMNHMHSMM